MLTNLMRQDRNNDHSKSKKVNNNSDNNFKYNIIFIINDISFWLQ